MLFVRRQNPVGYFGRLSLLKKLFWLYFLLLIFEGALRKWVVPQLSAPLLVVRDPISVLIIWEAYRTHKWPSRWSAMLALLAAGMMTLFLVQTVMGDNPFLVGLFGLRTYLLPFPVIFIMAENLDEEDLHKLGMCILWLVAPMTILEVLQYLAPAGAFVNRGAYEGSKQITYLSGHVRSSGTFSFVVGVSDFDTLVGVFLLYSMVGKGFAKTWLQWVAAGALVLSIPTTGARALVGQLAATVGAAAAAALMGVSQFTKMLHIIATVAIVFVLVSQLPVFSNAMRTMDARFSGATAVEGGTVEASVFERTIQPTIDAIDEAASTQNWVGIGLGRGAVAVSAFLDTSDEAVAGEGEYSREFEEMGPIAGVGFELFKLLLGISVFSQAVMRAREHEPLALLLVPFVMLALFFSLFEQPTEQGFTVISTAFCIAATKLPAKAPIETLSLALHRQQTLLRLRAQRR